ncbi:glycoside hydrolase family 16 protein, partial [Zopfia rhizophila CBS 207.26]
SLFAPIVSQQYRLIQSYTLQNFFEEFKIFTVCKGPTDGFVQYVPYSSTVSTGLIGNTSDLIYLGVDHNDIYDPHGIGRPSVRLESKMTFAEGLFVLGLTHLPTGCGTWPAWWSVGLGDWPEDGEIDVIEGSNDGTRNVAALHAAGDCIVPGDVSQTAIWKNTDCNANHRRMRDDIPGYSLMQLEVYTMEWTRESIKIWFFPSALIPYSLTFPSSYYPSYSHTDLSTWAPPSASFSGPYSFSFGDKFFNHTIVIDITFCGGWAGGSYGKTIPICPKLEGASAQDSCKTFVENNRQAFVEAYWGIRSHRVWQ